MNINAQQLNGCEHVETHDEHVQIEGTLDVQVRDFPRAQSKLIKKFAHGRASETKDGGIQIFLKVFLHENENIVKVMREESRLAVKAVEDYLLRGAGR